MSASMYSETDITKNHITTVMLTCFRMADKKCI